MRKLIDATFVAYAEKLRRGDVRVGPSDLDRLHKLWRQLDLELEHSPTATRATIVERSAEHTFAVLEALRETGALKALGLRSINETTDLEEEP